MNNVHDNVLSCIGDTPIVRLRSVASHLKTEVYVKLEYLNPGNSIKDRIAMQIIDDAESSGALKPGGTIVEATSGNTGAGLAMIAAIRGYKCIFVLPDKQSEEKRAALRAYGAKVVVTPTDVAPDDPRSYYKTAERIVSETPGAFYANQYHNPSNPRAHHRSTGPEIWRQMGDSLDTFIAGLGTGGTVTGTAAFLKEQKPDMTVVGVDPVGSLYYDVFHAGVMTTPFTYVLEGIGEDFMPSTVSFDDVDDIVRVRDAECYKMTRRLAREEGVFAGASSGAAVAGALRWLARNDRDGARALILLPDSGSRYLSKAYNDAWIADMGYDAPEATVQLVSEWLDDNPTTDVATVDGPPSAPVAGWTLVRDGGAIHGIVAPGESTPTPDFCVVHGHSEMQTVRELLAKIPVAIVMDGQMPTHAITPGQISNEAP